jgi:hypothetical protein
MQTLQGCAGEFARDLGFAAYVDAEGSSADLNEVFLQRPSKKAIKLSFTSLGIRVP